MATSITILFLFVCLAVFAYLKEREDQANCYRIAVPKERDTVKQTIRKVSECISYDTKSIKWRRSLICALVSTFLIFSVIQRRLPHIREFILYLLCIYVIQYMSWKNYNRVISYPAKNYGMENLQKLKLHLTK